MGCKQMQRMGNTLCGNGAGLPGRSSTCFPPDTNHPIAIAGNCHLQTGRCPTGKVGWSAQYGLAVHFDLSGGPP